MTLDADTQFAPSTIANLLRHFAADPDGRLGAVAGVVKVGNRHNLVTRWQAVEYIAQIGVERAAQDALGAIMIVPGACAAWRKTALQEAGGYSEATLAEDFDLTLTLHRLRYRVTQDDDAIAYTEAPEPLAALVKQRTRWVYGSLQTLWKHRALLCDPGWLGMVLMPFTMLAIVVPLVFLPLVYVVAVTAVQAHGAQMVLAYVALFAAAHVVLTAADATRRRDLPLVPAISNFRDGAWDADVIHTIVTDRDRMAAHVDAIADVVDEAGWDGIDLDYESLRGEDRDAYSAFARTLGERLRSTGRQLTITVQAKTSDQGTASFHAAQDYEALAAAADELRIMAYDRHWSGSDPGPIAPVAWVEEVLAYALRAVPADKIALGLGSYGYDWTPQGGTDLMGADAASLARQQGVAIQWDAESQAPWFGYTDASGTAHTVWFEDARSIAAKVDVARRLGLTRVFVWRLGGEQPQIWASLR